MNLVATYLRAHRQRLQLERYGLGVASSSLVLTPRFRASRHVVFLVMPEGGSAPALVAKVARLPGASASLEREAENLRLVEALNPEDAGGAPRLLAFDSVDGWPLLLETALVGPLMTPDSIRARREASCSAVLKWLLRLHDGGRAAALVDFTAAVDAPLRRFADTFPLAGDEAELLERTRALAAPLAAARLPAVLEHGDLSHPNIVWLDDRRVGVIDWELASAGGLPAHDLFFFLSYAGFASFNAGKTGDYTGAFARTFFSADAWAYPYIESYAHALRLSPEQLTGLFVVCWARYLTGLIDRLEGVVTGGRVPDETAAWLRANRYFALWRYAVEHVESLAWRVL